MRSIEFVRMPGQGILSVLTIMAVLGLTARSAPGSLDDDEPSPFEAIPLPDLGRGHYLGTYQGGLYPEGSNRPPLDHMTRGLDAAERVQPLDSAGRPDPLGKYVLLSIGMSNAHLEFCGQEVTCSPESFVGQAALDPGVEKDRLAIVDGAIGGRTAGSWNTPGAAAYDIVLRTRLSPRGLTESQVQIVWLKEVNARPRASLPDPRADAIRLEAELGEIVRALKERYHNLQLVFLSSRTYGGYAKTPTNPEPFAYESGFAVKWVIEAQIRQGRTGKIDPRAGNLGPDRAPWIGWGPYLWTSGARPRLDGLNWAASDVVADGTHPSRSGVRKVGTLLLQFFESSGLSRCWFMSGQETCKDHTDISRAVVA